MTAWKTKLCHHYEKQGHCNRGEGCTFAHGSEELQGPGEGSGKTRLMPSEDKIPCKFYQKGTCWKGEQCLYSHDA